MEIRVPENKLVPLIALLYDVEDKLYSGKRVDDERQKIVKFTYGTIDPPTCGTYQFLCIYQLLDNLFDNTKITISTCYNQYYIEFHFEGEGQGYLYTKLRLSKNFNLKNFREMLKNYTGL